jgi:potassium-transporting ATPase KdpC subunit
MVRDIRRAITSLLVLTVLLGGVFPVAVWAVAQIAFSDRADGSLIVRDGTVVGSSLLAQGFASPQYFQPRPSAVDYNASGSAASNLGPNSADLAAAVKERIAAVSAANGIAADVVPVDLVTASASGLDPDISRQGALVQVDRVAKARGLDPAVVRALVLDRMQSPTIGLLGTTRVNVLELNLALDRIQP